MPWSKKHSLQSSDLYPGLNMLGFFLSCRLLNTADMGSHARQIRRTPLRLLANKVHVGEQITFLFGSDEHCRQVYGNVIASCTMMIRIICF